MSFHFSHISKLQELLTSPCVDLRIASGEAIALIFNLARQKDEVKHSAGCTTSFTNFVLNLWVSDRTPCLFQEFEGENFYELCDTLKQLATDGNKHRAKKERRTQRSSFRDILRCVEEGDAPSYSVKFGIESIHIDSWPNKVQYDSLCHVLGTGMNVHLQVCKSPDHC